MTRRLLAEGLGTGLLLFVIVGSGIAAENLGRDPAGQLLAHALAVGLGLTVLIGTMQTVSGSHFNPSVTLAFWRTGDLAGQTALLYMAVQVAAAIGGVIAANLTFQQGAVGVSTLGRNGAGLLGAEAIGTFVLVLVILSLVRTDRTAAIPAMVGAWVATIVFATSSTGFANPAVTIARMFTDSYTGIAPTSTLGFLGAQLAGAVLAAAASNILYPVPDPEPAST